MRSVAKGEAPPELVEYLKTPGVHYDSSPTPIKNAVRRDSLRDQYGLCCYCCGRVGPSSGYQQIEHLVARSVDPERTLDWDNLLVSCASGRPEVASSGKSELTCDDHKKNDHLAVSPLDADCEARFLYVRDDGRILAVSGDIDAATTISILNLNCKRLRDARFGAMKVAEDLLSELDLDVWAARFLEPVDGVLPAYEPAIWSLTS